MLMEKWLYKREIKLYMKLTVWPCSSSDIFYFLFFCAQQHHPACLFKVMNCVSLCVYQQWPALVHDFSLHIIIWNQRVMSLPPLQCEDDEFQQEYHMHARSGTHPFAILERTSIDSVQGHVSAPSHRHHSDVLSESTRLLLLHARERVFPVSTPWILSITMTQCLWLQL